MPQKGSVEVRVLVVTNLYPTERKPQWGTFVKEQVEALRASSPAEFEIEVYLVDGSVSKTAYFRALWALPGKVRRGNYDLVHVHFGLTLITVLGVDVPVVVTFHGSDLLREPVGTISRLLARKARRVIVVSENLRAALGYGKIIPCGIDTEKFALPQSYVRSRSPSQLKVLFPANPSVTVKNYPLFHKCCRLLEKKGYTVQEVCLKDVPRDRVPEFFWDADLMILTSHSEGSPTVVKEAIAAKLPFVSVDVGDVKCWASRINFGTVVNNRDPDAIAHAALYLLETVSSRVELDNQQVLEIFDHKQISLRLLSLYSELLSTINQRLKHNARML